MGAESPEIGMILLGYIQVKSVCYLKRLETDAESNTDVEGLTEE